MKKVLQLLTGFALVLTLVSALATPVAAEEVEEEAAEPELRQVIVHYHRWDGEYEGRNIWTWNTGTGGSEAPVEQSGTSDFGATFTINLGEDAGDEIGLILRYSAAWGDGQNDRDGLIPEDGGDKANKAIVIRDENGEFTGFDEDGVKHVFVIEGMNEVIYQDPVHGPLREGFGTLMVVYFDPAQEFDGWNIWTWGTGTDGSAPANDTGVPFAAALDVDGGIVDQEMFRVAFLSIAEDADDTIGFIVRTDAWDKQYEDDLFIDVSEIKGSGLQTMFYIGGTGDFIEDFESFEAIANAFEIESALFQDRLSLLLNFNKPIQVALDDGAEVLFDDSWFTVRNAAGAVVPVANVAYEQGVNSVDEFMIIFENELSAAQGPFTVEFESGFSGAEATAEANIPTVLPNITIIGSTNVTLELGDRYSLPTFRATEDFHGATIPIFTARVKEGHGFLSTREAGIYELVLTAADRFGNVAEETITVTVIDPCDDQAHLNNVIAPLALMFGLPLLAVLVFKGNRKG